MANDIFMAGVAPGSPSSEDEVKMLLCFILSGIGQPISFTQLYDAMSEQVSAMLVTGEGKRIMGEIDAAYIPFSDRIDHAWERHP